SFVGTASDFDADGADDFVMVARFGNPQNAGNVGEAYLVYGRTGDANGDGVPEPETKGNRFGGTISANAVSSTVSGVVFQAPPVRASIVPDDNARTEGITDFTFVPDVSIDGRPELMFGLPHVHGAFDATDYDPADADETGDDGGPFCYPDLLVNNFSEDDDGNDDGWYSGGMAVIVNSTNRDASPPSGAASRLERTTVSLELTGNGSSPQPTLSTGGFGEDGDIVARASNFGAEGTDQPNVGIQQREPDEAGRIAGARFVAGGFDYLLQLESAREGLWGYRVGTIDDITSDGNPEIIVSAPLNERYLQDLANNPPTGFAVSPHLASTEFRASITVFPGWNYNATTWRDNQDADGACVIPALDNSRSPGTCTTPVRARNYAQILDVFGIFAEEIDDWLSDGQSAGDFNQDGTADLLCGARLNDRSAVTRDSGATYIVYGRGVAGAIRLADADDPSLRTPMIRIRGIRPGDQIGWTQTSVRDVNGDRVADVFLGSPHVDGGTVSRAT
ncbi:MAG: hypothetical protein R3282_10760, partial [Rhodothermales bacterium]|nr:hypothetical protein [Rhodothermales bacterium]